MPSPGPHLVDNSGRVIRSFGLDDALFRHSTVSPDGSTIAYASGGAIHLLDIDSGADRVLPYRGSGPIGVNPLSFSPDGSSLLVSREAEGPAHEQVLAQRNLGHLALEFQDVVVPVRGAGPEVVLGSQVHLSIGGGGNAIFSPDGTQVLAVYTQKPVGAWLFDVTTGAGEELLWNLGHWEEMTWQRLAP